MSTIIGFYLLSALAFVSGLVVVTTRNLLHAVLALAVSSLAVAGLMLTLAAEFLALVLILVYIGAVVVIGVFAVMLTGHFDQPLVPASNELKPLGAATALAFFLLISGVLLIQPPARELPLFEMTVEQIGRLLLTEFVLPFELVSVLLLAAMVGAIVVSKGKED
ncbi:NADH-quinone oxidoreductase subunit J [candidate division FCPU426 bacterium]|nr:NADH-quinone oxidoreductase subunit J [candidate division FCPU426 bacterium]